MQDTKTAFPMKPGRSVPVSLSEPLARPGRMNPVSIQSVGFLLILVATLVLGFFLFLYDAGTDGAANLDKLNWRLCWTVAGTGAGLGGLLLIVLSRLEIIAQTATGRSASGQ